jgi:nicotinamidase-related amidase
MNKAPQKKITLHLRSQSLQKVNLDFIEWQTSILEETLPYRQIAILICDMWDTHWSLGAAERVNQMAPRMNAVISIARELGSTILHAPSETMAYYAGSPARKRATSVPAIPAPVEVELPDFALPIDDSDGGSDTGEKVHQPVWTCQHPAIQIDQAKDYITDNGLQVLGILRALKIKRLLIMGVHTNMCVLNRSFAIKQMVRWSMPVALVRDLTDALYNPALPPYVSHEMGTELVIGYIEKFWCPTISSSELLKGNQ